ncbi:MAG: Gfo/Idh/MocA family oxidoreductase, partial [Lachnospiraceae bacterium]|nr:Gfo/Idh/MocA family oxidoreductase [Lachnospiraceae bacterium]
MIRTAVIGMGNMGTRYSKYISEGKIEGMELCAITRIREPYRTTLENEINSGLPVYDSADDLFSAVDKGEINPDAVVITTPHYSHSPIAIKAFERGLNVLCDKPSGVYSRQAREMEEKAASSGKVFSMVFHQRTYPVYKKIRELVQSGEYGALKRVNWVVTDWYRPDKYYLSGSWRATWDGEGGGVLINQCPHNLDLLQWIFGVPVSTTGFCIEGHFHNIPVEDDVTAYFKWENGATGVFVTSTGDAPGVNRLEISMEEGMIVCEEGRLSVRELFPELGCREEEYRREAEDFFKKIKGVEKEIEIEDPVSPYEEVLRGFSDECRGKGISPAPGSDGRKSLLISNAIYLSSWEGRSVRIP